MIQPENNGKIALIFTAVVMLAAASANANAATVPSRSYANDTVVAQSSTKYLNVTVATTPSPLEQATKVAKTVSKTKYDTNDMLTAEELKAVLYSVGFRGTNLKEAWAIAMKESNGRPMAHNRNSSTGDNSYGLFQINMIGSLGPNRLDKFNLKSNSDLFDPVTSAEIAFFMSNGGQDWSAWHGITSRTKEFMKDFPSGS
jgi:endo-1,4-beta-mannosidase